MNSKIEFRKSGFSLSGGQMIHLGNCWALVNISKSNWGYWGYQ